jgi:hypothetical protein
LWADGAHRAAGWRQDHLCNRTCRPAVVAAEMGHNLPEVFPSPLVVFSGCLSVLKDSHPFGRAHVGTFTVGGRTDKARPASSSLCYPAEFGRVMIDSVTLSLTMKALAPSARGHQRPFGRWSPRY